MYIANESNDVNIFVSILYIPVLSGLFHIAPELPCCSKSTLVFSHRFPGAPSRGEYYLFIFIMISL